jgi:hypothetical protein
VRRIRRWFALSLLLLSGTAAALPEQVVRDLPSLRFAGEGRLRWLGLHIYDAALWINGAQWSQDKAFALDIRYARNVSGRRLVETSIDEMRRLGFGDEARLARWAGEMLEIFPDVKKGERITGVNRPGVGVEFYHQERLAGVIRNPEFARAFFAIWLDARTREPGLRNALFGAR